MYQRKTISQVEGVEGIGFRTISGYEDEAHDIEVELLIEAGTGILRDAQVRLNKVPFEECAEGARALESLIGRNIVRPGIRKEIYQAVAGAQGCTHVAELVMEGIIARLQATERVKPRGIPERALTEEFDEWLKNMTGTCIHFNQPYWRPPV